MTRSILRLLGTRYGIALVLVVAVAAVVGVTRLASGPDDGDTVYFPPSVAPPASVDPSQSALGDDSVANPEGEPTPSSIPGARPPEAVAVDFAKAWLRTDGVSSDQWRNGLAPYSTRDLMDLMEGADPASVPADAIRGEARTRVRDSEVVEVDIPVSPGLLRLVVILAGGRWLVNSVDWERP